MNQDCTSNKYTEQQPSLDVENQCKQHNQSSVEGPVPIEKLAKKQNKERRCNNYIVLGSVFMVLLVVAAIVGVVVVLTKPDASSSTLPTKPPPRNGLSIFLTAAIQLDEKPNETGWSLNCDVSGVVANIEPLSYSGPQFINEKVDQLVSVFEGDSCTFKIVDTGNDGINFGGYQVYYGNDISNESMLLVEGGGNFEGSSTSMKFKVENPLPSTNEPTTLPMKETTSMPSALLPSIGPNFTPTNTPFTNKPTETPTTKKPTLIPTTHPQPSASWDDCEGLNKFFCGTDISCIWVDETCVIASSPTASSTSLPTVSERTPLPTPNPSPRRTSQPTRFPTPKPTKFPTPKPTSTSLPPECVDTECADFKDETTCVVINGFLHDCVWEGGQCVKDTYDCGDEKLKDNMFYCDYACNCEWKNGKCKDV